MKNHGTLAKMAALAIAGCALPYTPLATAQSDAVRSLYASAANVPTNIPGVRTFPEAPKGFNPVAANDVDLATYGFPPRPDKQAQPQEYALWERAMKAAKIRWNGELKPLADGGRGGSSAAKSLLRPAVVSQVTVGPQQLENVNASGVVLTNKLTKWNSKTSFSQVSAQFTVPTAVLPFDNTSCTATDYKQFNFAGIDSSIYAFDDYQSALVPGLQGGTYADVPCGGGAAFYFAEFGVGYPLYRGFAVNPGDGFEALIATSGPSNEALVLLEDFTTQTYSTYDISTPSIVGQNIGWIVMRPCCTPSEVNFPLPNTIGLSISGATASTADSKEFYAGSQAATTEVLTMTDDAGDQNIENVTQGSGGLEGLTALTFATNGCAWSDGCNP